MKQQVLTYVQEVSDENYDYRDPAPVSGKGHSTSTSANANEDDEHDLHSFMSFTRQNGAASSTLSKELEDFLESKSTSIQSLADYQVIGRAFIKVNSSLPSCAASSVLQERSLLRDN